MALLDVKPRPHLDPAYARGFVEDLLEKGASEEEAALALYAHNLATAMREDAAFARGFKRACMEWGPNVGRPVWEEASKLAANPIL